MMLLSHSVPSCTLLAATLAPPVQCTDQVQRESRDGVPALVDKRLLWALSPLLHTLVGFQYGSL